MRVLSVAVSLLAVLFAGCVGEPSPGPAPSADRVVTDPLDYSYLETDNGTEGHVHDYWNGQETLVVAGGRTSTSSSCTGCGEGGFGIFDLRPPSGSIVPQGARFVDVTFTWVETGESVYDAVEVWIKTAADAETERAGPAVNGEVFRFESTNEDNDPPHHVLSLWVFELRFFGGDEIRFEGDIQAHVTATRGLEIPPWPPHPDHWQGASELPVIDRDGSVFYYDRREVEGAWSSSCMVSCDLFHAPDEGVIVPPLTGRVAVTLTFEPGAMPAGIGLLYHGADTWEMEPLEPVATQPLEWTYEIPIEPGRHDSPYALQSLWQFQLFLDQPQPVKAWHGDYHLSVVAHRA